MKFDCTGGKPAKYAVRKYSWNVNDTFYYSDYKSAKAKLNELAEATTEKGTVLSLYDINKDIRKEFIKQ